MKKNILYLLVMCLLVTSACKKNKDNGTAELPGDNTVGILQAFTQVDENGRVNPPATVLTRRTYGQPDSLYNFVVNASLVKANAIATSDVGIIYTLDYSNLSAINLKRGLAGLAIYEPLPDSVLVFDKKTAVISSGKRISADVGFTISSKKIEGGHLYALPVKIAINGSGSYKVDGQVQTAYFVIKTESKTYPDFDRSAWKVLGFDSEETSGEGANNGRVIQALDGKPGTFWHTQYSSSLPGFPHWASFDMGSARTIHGFAIQARIDGPENGPKDVVVTKSSDGITWTDMAQFSLKQTNALQRIDIIPVDNVRYFKLTFLNNFSGNKYCVTAEIGAY